MMVDDITITYIRAHSLIFTTQVRDINSVVLANELGATQRGQIATARLGDIKSRLLDCSGTLWKGKHDHIREKGYIREHWRALGTGTGLCTSPYLARDRLASLHVQRLLYLYLFMLWQIIEKLAVFEQVWREWDQLVICVWHVKASGIHVNTQGSFMKTVLNDAISCGEVRK